MAKLVQNVQPSFKYLDSLEDDLIIVVDNSDEDEEVDKDGLYATSNIELKMLQFLNPHLSGLLKFKSLPTRSSFFSLKSINWNLRRTKLKLKLLSLNVTPSNL
ncbi:hypothetical protein Tco_1348482, partial [Tanacetum coccineum]